MSEVLIAILAGLGGMLGWGLADFFAKKTIDRMGDVTTLFWSQTLGIVPLFIVFAFQLSLPHLNSLGGLYLIVLGVWSGLSYIPTYIAFGKGKVSLLSPIFATYAVIVAILSSVFFGENIPVHRELALAIVFTGVLIINGDPRDLWLLVTGRRAQGIERIRGLPEILLAVCLYSVWLIALDRFINGMSWIPLLLGIRISSAFALLIYSRVTKRSLIVPDGSLWKVLFLIGLFDVGAFGCVACGFSRTSHPSIVAMLSGAFSLPTIILGRVFLKEETTLLPDRW